jgi:hypothetical protein
MLFAARKGNSDRFGKGKAMRRLPAIVFLICLASGCTAEGRPQWLNEALKDARGDNMQMRSGSSSMTKDLDSDMKPRTGNSGG